MFYVAVPVAAGILYPSLQWRLPPELAALAMAFSSVSVIVSSLLLKRYSPPRLADLKTPTISSASPKQTTSFTRLHDSEHTEAPPVQQHPPVRSDCGCGCVECKCGLNKNPEPFFVDSVGQVRASHLSSVVSAVVCQITYAFPDELESKESDKQMQMLGQPSSYRIVFLNAVSQGVRANAKSASAATRADHERLSIVLAVDCGYVYMCVYSMLFDCTFDMHCKKSL